MWRNLVRGVLVVATVMATIGSTGSTADPSSLVQAERSKPWQLRKSTSSSTCYVLASTASPIGELVESFDTKKEACQAAKDRYDDSMSDQTKCWNYGPATKTGCKAEGIDLP